MLRVEAHRAEERGLSLAISIESHSSDRNDDASLTCRAHALDVPGRVHGQILGELEKLLVLCGFARVVVLKRIGELVIANTTNRGFPAAINQGLKVGRGEYLVLLNNDVVVTDGWLDQLVALATAKLGTDNNLTAKRAKDAKKEREKNERKAFGSVCRRTGQAVPQPSLSPWTAELSPQRQRIPTMGATCLHCLLLTPKSIVERSFAGSAPADSTVRKLFALIAWVHQMMGNWQEAINTCE
jgi:hypothetical protein